MEPLRREFTYQLPLGSSEFEGRPSATIPSMHFPPHSYTNLSKQASPQGETDRNCTPMTPFAFSAHIFADPSDVTISTRTFSRTVLLLDSYSPINNSHNRSSKHAPTQSAVVAVVPHGYRAHAHRDSTCCAHAD
jgi:hypothetical protein